MPFNLWKEGYKAVFGEICDTLKTVSRTLNLWQLIKMAVMQSAGSVSIAKQRWQISGFRIRHLRDKWQILT